MRYELFRRSPPAGWSDAMRKKGRPPSRSNSTRWERNGCAAESITAGRFGINSFQFERCGSLTGAATNRKVRPPELVRIRKTSEEGASESIDFDAAPAKFGWCSM